MHSDFLQKILGMLQRPRTVAPGPGYENGTTPPFLPGAPMQRGGLPGTVAPTPTAIDMSNLGSSIDPGFERPSVSTPETSKVTGGDYLDRLESEITKPMPRFQFQEPQRPGGVRGLLAMVASGIGHGAGAQGGVGGGLTAAYEGNRADMEKRRQQAYAMQMQQYKGAYDEEANRRANLVKVIQQRRLDEANHALQAHQMEMEKNASRVADINENRYNEDRAERANRREMEEQKYKDTIEAQNQRLEDTLRSLEGRNKETVQGRRDVAQIGANARIATGGAGVVKAKELIKSADDIEKAVGLIDKQILDIKTKIGTKATGHRGELLYPPDANGRYSVLDDLENRKGRLLEIGKDYRAKADEMMTGTTTPPKKKGDINPVKGGGSTGSSRRIQINAPSFRVNPQDDPLGWFNNNRP